MILYVVTKKQDEVDEPVKVFPDPKEAKAVADALNKENPKNEQTVYIVEV